MKGHDVIPQADDAFPDWSRAFVMVVVANDAAWNIPQTEATALQTAVCGQAVSCMMYRS
ncbi:MAG: hypothetical protein LBD58_06565 [Treponema sp.]|nr:hypothetical protein [Treponema sp.]